jgi:hypothetical protein
MKAGGGKRKGGAFERDICKLLSLWLTRGKRTDLFWRSAMSGGRTTVARKRGELVRQFGDVCAVAEEGHRLTDRWYIECKHVKVIGLVPFLLSGRGPLAQYWETAVVDAIRHGRRPMLIVRQNLLPTLVLIHAPEPDAARARVNREGVLIYRLDDMLKTDPRSWLNGR